MIGTWRPRGVQSMYIWGPFLSFKIQGRMKEANWIRHDTYGRKMKMTNVMARCPIELAPKHGEKKDEGNYA